MKKKLIISLFLILMMITTLSSYSDDFETATMYYNEAVDLYKQDDVEKSIEFFKKAIEIKPDFYEAHYNLSQILISINRNDEAIGSLEAMAKIQPNNTENIYNLGRIQYKRGYLAKAHEYLSMIQEGDSQYESAKILLNKIEKRQEELNLENKIKDRDNIVDIQGKAKGVVLSEIKTPSGVALDSRGNIYIASFLENLIYKISIYGQKTIFSKSALIKGPIGLVIDKNDNIYVANYTTGNIVKITPNNQTNIFADIKKPYCMTYDEANNRIYVSEQETNKLIKFDL